MSNLFITIVPNLKLKNGNHTIRIAVTHSGQTRYIPTDVVISTEKEFKDGRIVKRPDKDALNLKLRKILNSYEDKIAQIQFADSLSCSQLISMLKGPASEVNHRTLADIANEYLNQIDEEERTKSHKMYKLAIKRYLSYAGQNTLMEHITPLRINKYILELQKDKLSPTSINIYVTLLKVIINYAIKMQYVSFRVNPFITAKIPTARKRDTFITVEQLKRIRDAKLDQQHLIT